MKKIVGGVSLRAQNSYMDDHPVETVNLAPSVGEINEVIDFFQQNNSESIESVLDANTTPEAIRKLISRLVPYSGCLQGTKTHIMYERAKLLAILPSPLITAENVWRYFITFAPADVYEPRLFDITIDEEIQVPEPTWDHRRRKVKKNNTQIMQCIQKRQYFIFFQIIT